MKAFADPYKGHDIRRLREAVENRPSAAFCSSLVTAAYESVRLIPRDFARLASRHFYPAGQKQLFQPAEDLNAGKVHSGRRGLLLPGERFPFGLTGPVRCLRYRGGCASAPFPLCGLGGDQSVSRFLRAEDPIHFEYYLRPNVFFTRPLCSANIRYITFQQLACRLLFGRQPGPYG